MATPTLVTLANANQFNQINTGTALSNSVNLTDISPGGSNLGQAFQTQPAQLYPGQLLRFHAFGNYSTTGTPTLLLGVYYGGAAGTNPLCATIATTTASGVTNGTWSLDAKARVITAGTTATIVSVGSVLGIAATSANPTLMPPTSTLAGGSYDTSIAKIITVAAQWGTQSSSNTIQCFYWTVEYLTEG